MLISLPCSRPLVNIVATRGLNNPDLIRLSSNSTLVVLSTNHLVMFREAGGQVVAASALYVLDQVS